ncbi:hypothetical protein GOQ27_03185 [Clostridium sp. D2Q-11]|uniref:Ferritin n=1 Tax=Anaeromonas frigoriresistens TaxID=2683708 RepID=A0A942URW0_9FIRM|nr:ferritin-like domain-containing protein [Anaeromonas frigoriresistens]MBS4537448.1 hypothetical protein [Anaeromonas frigoriresistens]
MNDYHESIDLLDEESRNYVRALHSLMEEVEAVDWYHQRVVATKDEQLKAIMAHNRNEEIEHACMALEWLRRNMPGWDEQLRTYLFTEDPILEVEEKAEEDEDNNDGDLGIGKLK